MNPWSLYESRIKVKGGTKREAAKLRELRVLDTRLSGSLSYHSCVIDGEQRNAMIINSDNLDEKSIIALPGEDLPHGGQVDWMGYHWLITSLDANTELYTKGKMQQCNYLLRWVASDDSIQERWCIVEDGTTYLTGEAADRNYILTLGDSRVSVTVPKDQYTLQFDRESRFLIDDYGSGNVLAYRLTKPFKLGGSFGDRGVFIFVMQECNTEDTDNFELHIANYYDHFPRDNGPHAPDGLPPYVTEEPPDDIPEVGSERKVWI